MIAIPGKIQVSEGIAGSVATGTEPNWDVGIWGPILGMGYNVDLPDGQLNV